MWLEVIYASQTLHSHCNLCQILVNHVVVHLDGLMVKREVFIVFLTAVCFLQAKEMETCLLSDTQLSDTGPLILFLIDINTMRSVFSCRSVKAGFTVAQNQAFHQQSLWFV